MDFDRLNRKLEGLEKASKNGQRAKNLSSFMRLPEIWKLAYANIYSNEGAITKGIDEDTLDGMSSERIAKIINTIKDGSYQPKPVRRAYIPKRDGKKRPLGVPSGNDKLVQAVIKILLEQVYEPVFITDSHGFRPNKSCHTALNQIKHTFTAVKWFVEFDIKGFFDNVNHNTLITLLEKKIDDKTFIDLIRRFLKAGYMEDWKLNRTYSGTPQGGIISPILSNIYLHELDQFMTSMVESFHKGKRRPHNRAYGHIDRQKRRLRRETEREGLTPERIQEFKALEAEGHRIPSQIENTDKFKRLLYCRYADDFIVGVIGSHHDAKHIMTETRRFLQNDLHLELSDQETCVSRATQGIEFLGYGIHTQISNRTLKMKVNGVYCRKRTIHGSIQLSIPIQKIRNFCNAHEYGNWQNRKPLARRKLLTSSEAEIIETYNSELRGLANYYMLARDMKSELHFLNYMAHNSLLKTLANKYKCKVTKIARLLKRKQGLALKVKVGDGWKDYHIFQIQHWTTPKTTTDDLPILHNLYTTGTELISRIESKQCEYCGRKDKPVEVHHIRKLKALRSKTHLEN